ncbi:Lipase 1 [Spathaspora sp. JA1]|nr:Lipase 1 [Spathaspora sp. JA1]
MFASIEVKNVWQMVVRSEDSFGKPTVLITTVIEPLKSDPSKLLSYQTFEDAANLTCSPSYGFLAGAPLITATMQLDMGFMVRALREGYFVVSSDYEGLNSAFTAGWRSGKAVLDSIRAVLGSEDVTGVKKDAKVALWGYSGGSLASGWAASLQPTYAPELNKNLIGAALGGFVTNITAVAEYTDGQKYAALIPNAFHGLANEYPTFKQKLEENVNPEYSELFDQGSQLCLIPALPAFENVTFLSGSNPVIPVGFGLLEDEEIREVVDSNSILNLNKTYLPEIPIFVYHGTFDLVVPIKDVRKTYKNWCEWGIKSFEFTEDLFHGHKSEQFYGSLAAWTWLEDRFKGNEPIKGCKNTKRIANYLYPNITATTRSYFDELFSKLITIGFGPDEQGFMADI